MRRVREESSETYEVSGAEICQALGLHYSEVDLIEIKPAPTAGSKYRLTIANRQSVDVPVEVPEGRATVTWHLSDFVPVQAGYIDMTCE